MNVQCPNCQAKFKAPDHYNSKKVKCSKCSHSFIAEPFQPIVEKIPASKRKDNIFIRLWNGSPVYFRNSFLATLGVISALVFAYYLMNIPKFVSKGTISQEQKAEIMPASSSDMKLAACVVLLNYGFQLETISNIRVNAAQNLQDKQDELGLYAFLAVIKVTESQLEELYMKVHNLNVPNDKTVQTCYQTLLEAINAEYAFQKSLLSYSQNPDNLQIKSNIHELSKKTINKGTDATMSMMNLLSETDNELFKKIVYVWNIDSK